MSSERIMEVVVEELRKWPTGTDEINDDSRLEEDLGLDMLDRVEVVMDLEDAFGIRIDAEDGELKTVGDLVKAVEGALHGRNGDGAARTRGDAEPGNAAAMRQALVQCELFIGNVTRHGHPTLNPGDKCTACEGADELRGMVCRALSAPPRNCDIGTAEDQEKRFEKFCGEHFDIGHACGDCKLFPVGCKLEWAQMPYAARTRGDAEPGKGGEGCSD